MEIDDLIQRVVEEVKQVPGVQALALGGSRVRGTGQLTGISSLHRYRRTPPRIPAQNAKILYNHITPFFSFFFFFFSFFLPCFPCLPW